MNKDITRLDNQEDDDIYERAQKELSPFDVFAIHLAGQARWEISQYKGSDPKYLERRYAFLEWANLLSAPDEK